MTDSFYNQDPSGPRRFWGKYRGICRSVNDPLRLGRIRAIVPEVSGPQNLLNWALPCFPFGADRNHEDPDHGSTDRGVGLFATPSIDSPVWIEFEAGDPDRPIWVGVWHGTPTQRGQTPPPGSNTEVNKLRPETTPEEVISGVDPDTNFPSYPREKLMKSDLLTIAAFRRLMFKLDLDPDDPVAIEPYLSIGLGFPENGQLAIDPESGVKNKHDLQAYARDVRHRALRDDRVFADRHVLERALEDIVRQAHDEIIDIGKRYVRILSDPSADSARLSQLGPQFESPSAQEFVHAQEPGPHSASSIWDSSFLTDESKIKIAAFETLALQSRRADVMISAGRISDLDTGSPQGAGEGQDLGRNITAAATNGVVIEAFVRTDAEIQGLSPGFQTAKAIHLFHRGPDLPYESVSNPPIELGRRFSDGMGPGRYLHPNGDVSLPPNKTFHRLLDERAAVSFNRHVHPYEFEIQLPDQTIPFSGSFVFKPTFPKPWTPDDPPPDDPPVDDPPTDIPVDPPIDDDDDDILVPGTPYGASGGFAPAGGGTPGGSFGAGQGDEQPLFFGPSSVGTPSIPLGNGSYSRATAGSLSSQSSAPGYGNPGAWGGAGPGEGLGMAADGTLGSAGSLGHATFRIPPPRPSTGGGWDPFNTNVTQGGFMGALTSITGTDSTPGALGQIGATLDAILSYLETHTCFDFEEYTLGLEVTDFSSFGARWWDGVQEVMELNLPDMGPNSAETMPVYVESSSILATRPPVNRSTRAYDPMSPDPVLGANAPSEDGLMIFGSQSIGDPRWSETDLLPYGAQIEPEALSQDLGSSFLNRVISGPQRGTFGGEIIVPGQMISWDGKTGPPCPPDRWVPTYHTPEDAWGTSVPGIVTGFIPYPGASDEGSIPCMTEFTRAN